MNYLAMVKVTANQLSVPILRYKDIDGKKVLNTRTYDASH